MRERLYWTVLGGVCFWLPSCDALVSAHSFDHELRNFVILPLAGFTLLCAVSWKASRREPKWGWMLAGIYILGSILNLALPVCFDSPLSLNVHGEITWRMILNGLLPPAYLWMAVLIVTPALVAMSLRPKRMVH